jgi:hypothetical protein
MAYGGVEADEGVARRERSGVPSMPILAACGRTARRRQRAFVATS